MSVDGTSTVCQALYQMRQWRREDDALQPSAHPPHSPRATTGALWKHESHHITPLFKTAGVPSKASSAFPPYPSPLQQYWPCCCSSNTQSIAPDSLVYKWQLCISLLSPWYLPPDRNLLSLISSFVLISCLLEVLRGQSFSLFYFSVLYLCLEQLFIY